MERDKLEKILNIEIDKWASKSYSELAQMRKPLSYSEDVDETTFNIEVQVLEVTHHYVQLSIAVDDGSGRWTTRPLAKSILTYRDGRVEKPE